MVDWAMGKFTYTIDQDTIHRRYEQHISTTTIILELTKIDNKLTKIVLKTQTLLFLIIFVAIADGVFLYKTYLCE